MLRGVTVCGADDRSRQSAASLMMQTSSLVGRWAPCENDSTRWPRRVLELPSSDVLSRFKLDKVVDRDRDIISVSCITAKCHQAVRVFVRRDYCSDSRPKVADV